MTFPVGHPPVWAGCSLVLIMLFPFATFAILRRRPQLTVWWFLAPLFAGAVVTGLMVLESLRGMAVGGPILQTIAFGAAEASAMLAWSAGSAALAAAFGLFRLRTRGRVVALIVSILVGLLSWFAGNRFLDVALRGGGFWP